MREANDPIPLTSVILTYLDKRQRRYDQAQFFAITEAEARGMAYDWVCHSGQRGHRWRIDRHT